MSTSDRVRSLGRRGALRHDGPDEADEFAGDGGHRARRPFAVADEMAIPAIEALLGAPGLRAARRRLALGARRQGPAERRAMAIVPGGLHEHAPRVGVAGLGEGPAPLTVPRRVLTGDQAQVGHQLAGVREPLEVDDFRPEYHGRERVDPPEAAQPADRLAIGGLLGERGDLLVQLGLMGARLLEGEQGGLEGPLEWGQVEALLTDPCPVALTPVLAGDVEAPVP